MSRVEIEKMYWDSEYTKFIKNKNFFFNIKIYGSYYLLENNINISFRKGATHMFANFIIKLTVAN